MPTRALGFKLVGSRGWCERCVMLVSFRLAQTFTVKHAANEKVNRTEKGEGRGGMFVRKREEEEHIKVVRK